MNRKPTNRIAEKTLWHQKLEARKKLTAEIELLAFGATLDEFDPDLEKEFKEIFGEKTT